MLGWSLDGIKKMFERGIFVGSLSHCPLTFIVIDNGAMSFIPKQGGWCLKMNFVHLSNSGPARTLGNVISRTWRTGSLACHHGKQDLLARPYLNYLL